MRNENTEEGKEKGMERLKESNSANRLKALEKLNQMKELEQSMELERCYYDKEQRVIRSIYKPKSK